MTNDQKVLEALLNAGGQEVLMVRLAEISPRSLPFETIRASVYDLRKAGFLIHTRLGSKKTGHGSYRLEAEEQERIRALTFIAKPRRQQPTDSVVEKSDYGINETNPTRVLRAEIYRRRKENHEKELKRGWNPEPVLKLRQAELLDWIEAQLEAMDPDPSPITETPQALPRRKGCPA